MDMVPNRKKKTLSVTASHERRVNERISHNWQCNIISLEALTLKWIITGNFDYINVRGIDIVKRLQWMNVIERRDYFVALTVFKCIRGMAPTYISDCITICNEVAVRDTRTSTSANLLTLPYASLDIFKNSFAYRGPFIWNDLPHDIRKCATLSCFKTALKAHILNV